MTIQLYMDYMSQPSRAVLTLFLIGGIPHQIVQTRVSLKQHKTNQYLLINPMGKVPAIYDPSNSLKLAQSHSIMRYLYRKYPHNTPISQWYAHNNVQRQAKIDQYLDYHHSNTRKCHHYIYNSLFVPRFKVVADAQYVQAQALNDVDRVLQQISEYYLMDNMYIVGDTPTLADLSAYYEIQFLLLTGYKLERWHKICQWMKRMGNIPEVRQANAVFVKLLPRINANYKAQLL